MNHELWQCNTIYAYRNRYELRIRLTKFSSTLVENPLQIHLFLQNKPNFKYAQMNVSNIITMNYKNFIPLAGYKNKPNQTQSNPKQTQFPKCQKWT